MNQRITNNEPELEAEEGLESPLREVYPDAVVKISRKDSKGYICDFT
jgi:hypothetical protein